LFGHDLAFFLLTGDYNLARRHLTRCVKQRNNAVKGKFTTYKLTILHKMLKMFTIREQTSVVA
jgi:hypothetical protein